MLYERYNAAKRALAAADARCRLADALASDTERALTEAGDLLRSCGSLRRSLEEKHTGLTKLQRSLIQECDNGTQEFDAVLAELDATDTGLSTALADLAATELPAALHAGGSGSSNAPGSNGRKRTLFDFADDGAIEALRRDLREAIDEMHELHEEQQSTARNFATDIVQPLKRRVDTAPKVPLLNPPGRLKQDDGDHAFNVVRQTQQLGRGNQSTTSSRSSGSTGSQVGDSATALTDSGRPIALSSSQIVAIYGRSQQRHLDIVATLLLSLSQHYEHCSLLVRDGAEAGRAPLPPEEADELRQVIADDADQLDDVVSELHARLDLLEADATRAARHCDTLRALRETLSALAVEIDSADIATARTALDAIAERRRGVLEEVLSLQDGLSSLDAHYRRFRGAFDALVVEIDRRRRFELSVAAMARSTRQAFHQLDRAESAKRTAFLKQFGDDLPADIWPNVTKMPAQAVVLQLDHGALLSVDDATTMTNDDDYDDNDGETPARQDPAKVAKLVTVTLQMTADQARRLQARLSGTPRSRAAVPIGDAGESGGSRSGIGIGSGSGESSIDSGSDTRRPRRAEEIDIRRKSTTSGEISKRGPEGIVNLVESIDDRSGSSFSSGTGTGTGTHGRVKSPTAIDTRSKDAAVAHNDDDDDDDSEMQEVGSDASIAGIPRLPQHVIDAALSRLRV